ncbi:MAG: DUF11 domain-containing protein [Patescibacteria group bacterium]
MKRKILKTLLGIIPIAALIAVLFTPFGIKSSTSAWPCYEPNVVFCGSNSKTEFANQMANGDGRNGDIGTMLGRMGIFPNDVLSSRMVDGEIHRDGSVWVGGTMVASNALNGQRGTYGINGPSTPWAGLYWASPSANFRPDVNILTAWVYMYNGQFKYGIIKACGNPIVIQLTPATPGITIEKKVSSSGDPVWRKSNTARAGETLKYDVYVKNNSTVSTEGMAIWDVLPPHVTLIPGTGRMMISNNTYNIPDSAITGRVDAGDWAPGQDGRMTFEVRINNDIPQGQCADLVNTGLTAFSRITTPLTSTATTRVCSVQPQVPSLIIEKNVSNHTSDPVWRDYDNGVPGDTLRYSVRVLNNSQTTANNVMVRDVLPPHVTLVSGSGKIAVGTTSRSITDDEIRNGVNMGNFVPGQDGYLTFEVKINNDFPNDGCQELNNTGFTRADSVGEISDTARTTVCIQRGRCTITVNKYNDLNGDAVRQENEPLLPNWKFTLKGTNLEDTKTTNSGGSLTYAGLEEGQYSVTEELQNGWKSTTGISQLTRVCPDKTLWFGNQQVSPPPPPPGQPASLPVSGPVEVTGGIMGTGALGYAGYMWRKSRKTLTDTLKRQ